jgi:xylulose-5-phosphate/fructose-6-phosphate phosphoketolase
MQVLNRTSRYHLVIQAAWKIGARNPSAAVKAESLVVRYERKIGDHRRYIREMGCDPEEITGWAWGGG